MKFLDAIKKAVKDARNHLITVPIQNKITVPHWNSR